MLMIVELVTRLGDTQYLHGGLWTSARPKKLVGEQVSSDLIIRARPAQGTASGESPKHFLINLFLLPFQYHPNLIL